MADNTPTFDTEGIVGDQGGSSSSGSYSPTVADVPEGVAQLIIDAIQQKGGAKQCVELPAFSEDAPEMADEYREHYGLDGVETMSVEDLFGFNWDGYDFVGTVPLKNSSELSEEQLDQIPDDQKLKSNGDLKQYVPHPDHVETFSEANVNQGAITPVSKGLNGHHGELIAGAFGGDSCISVGIGKDRNHDGDSVEARKFVSFQVSGSENAAFKRMKCKRDAGNMDQEDFEDWARANDFEEKLD